MSPHQGFSLTELILVLVLVGILSVGFVGLIASSGSYTPSLARDEVVSKGLLAQKLALSRTVQSGAVELRLSDEEDAVVLALMVGDEEIERRSIEARDLTINQPFEIVFNPDGTLASGDNQAILFSSSQSSAQACIFASGFPYAGSCDDGP